MDCVCVFTFVEVEPIDDNLYKWEARLFGFEGDLAKDMKKHSKKFVKMELTFPKDYPFAPPFIRVVEPRFKFRNILLIAFFCCCCCNIMMCIVNRYGTCDHWWQVRTNTCL